MYNDPDRQASQLFQCLTHDKKPLGLLIGGGCPYSMKDESGNPFIPDMKKLTEMVRDKLCTDGLNEPWQNIYDQLLDDKIVEPNIEHVLSRVRGLKSYVGSGEIKGLYQSTLTELESGICEKIIECVNKKLPNTSTPYHNLATWIGTISRSKPIEIFTTNYDLLTEQALEELRIPFFDGFVGAREPFFDSYAIEFDELPPRWARLWKIHGSINWRSSTEAGNSRVWRTEHEKGGDVVIHPSHLKYDQSRKMPYLAMMDRLRSFLSIPSSALIIVGYSFSDEHINDVLIQTLRGSSSSAIFALMYGELENNSYVVALAKGCGNFSVIAKNGAVIGTKEALWKEVKEQPDSNLPVRAVEWTKDDVSDSWKASFKLGDFLCLGAFLQEISGTKDLMEKADG